MLVFSLFLQRYRAENLEKYAFTAAVTLEN